MWAAIQALLTPGPLNERLFPASRGFVGLKITTQKIRDGKINQDFPDVKVEASGAKGDLTWSAEGPLPTGLKLDASTGVISGKPTETKAFPFTIRVVDNSGQSASQPFTITIST